MTFPKKRKRNMDSTNLFCPQSMTRVDFNMPHFQYKTLWGCLICQTVVLNKTAAINHSNICKLPITKEEDISVEELQ
ncbi:C2H2-type domain-containing protein [Aphis craccivora]|uniref:C2H2-type domain-containing protein n=1 Tax=Aphis craccivora TaxID=307492 RepID=A0A6G0VQ74_APHCR|nr:C2H2-type domain-containing protein [Aphis craccivora]